MEEFAMTVSEFCARWHISEPLYFKLRRKGLGPKVMRIGRRTLITPEANAEWQRQREEQQYAPTPEAA